MLKLIDQWGGPETYPHMAAGWAVAFDAPFGWMKQVPSDFGGTRNGMVVSLAEGHQGEERDPHAVQPRDRRGADHPARRPACRSRRWSTARRRSRWKARASSTPSTTPRRRSATPRSTSRSPATAPSTTTAGSRARSTGRRGRPSRAARCRTTPPGSSTTCARTSAWPTTWRRRTRRSWRSCRRSSCRKPRSTTCCRWTTASSSGWTRAAVGRPDLMAGRTSLTLAEGMTGMMEGVFINVKNRSKTITAEIEVPQGGGNGTILAQGGRFGGWSLYVKDGVPAYDYNFLGLQQTSIVASKPLAPGKATVHFDFAYDGGGPGKGGMGTLFVNGEKVGRGPHRAHAGGHLLRRRDRRRRHRPRHAGRRGDRRRGQVAVHRPHPEGDGRGSRAGIWRRLAVGRSAPNAGMPGPPATCTSPSAARVSGCAGSAS